MSKSKLLFALIPFIGYYIISCTTSSPMENVTADIDFTEVTYNKHIEPIISNYCTTCHSGKSPSAKMKLCTYSEVKYASENRGLLKRINDHKNPMPVGGLISKSERILVLKWAKNNYKKGIKEVEGISTAYSFNPPVITPIDINKEGFNFFEKMKGHWVGKMNLMGQNIPWFAFDYRPISSSHIHGIFEGGTVGNLFTSFFIADYKDTKTIMVRNGGILNGIYRTSYFLLDKVSEKNGESYFRFVDAYGGKQIMWIEITFKKNEIEFNSYTSRFGTFPKAKKHMAFQGEKMHMELSEQASDVFNYPQSIVEKSFPEGLKIVEWDPNQPTTTASYLWQDVNEKIEILAKSAKDPYPINKIPYLSQLEIQLPESTLNKKRSVYLSRKPLTNSKGELIMEYGYIKEDIMNENLLFSEIEKGVSSFNFTYIHPGIYFITVIVDADKNMTPSKKDLVSKSVQVTIKPESKQKLIL